jgi:C_GCAxxG_C_C family probable redox protein
MTHQPEERAPDAAVESVRELFIRDDNHFGCAETALVALQRRYGFENAGDSSSAMALNGGVAYSGGICGAISGAALAVGRIADERIDDHNEAKRLARRLIQLLLTEFEAEFGGRNCSELLEYDISVPAQHDAFIESGVWRDTCLKQIEFSTTWLWELAEPYVWTKTVRTLDA